MLGDLYLEGGFGGDFCWGGGWCWEGVFLAREEGGFELQGGIFDENGLFWEMDFGGEESF